ncbi:response regulator transcription factor [Celeribacter neptunius]|uniref:Two-component system, cell cycle response regulator CtrA n=1 Tax=Celeribacter neptunius TaxID=588602 RepID=A0A1I3VER4_9RHOB|nr:response regulator transcription factor [Celeribacter neptunius]SFJ92896.1 two-component system, cell cycle response regulator CtrA [Celeribacter neptunius]
MRVLLAETNWNAMTAAAGLDDAGLLVTRVNDGRELMDFADFGEQNAIVLDLDVPDINAFKLIEQLRHRDPLMPIYALTAHDDWESRKRAYEAGADDVISGPVNPAFLAAQIKAAVRRTAGYASKSLQVGALTLDTDHNVATINGQELQLTRKEYEILEMLVLNRERLVTRETFMNHLYAWNDEPDTRIINVYLSRIRQQIELCGGEPDIVETVWGLGYRITARADAAQAA